MVRYYTYYTYETNTHYYLYGGMLIICLDQDFQFNRNGLDIIRLNHTPLDGISRIFHGNTNINHKKQKESNSFKISRL